MTRRYGDAAQAVASRTTPEMGRPERMQLVVDILWDFLGGEAGPVSWVGFYLPDRTGRRLELGPRRDKPACSPIGLHGCCGKAWLTRETVIVDDVRTLGDCYIACDPEDRSELVVPLLDADGRCWAVIDLDSRRPGAFDAADAAGVRAVLSAAGLVPGDT